MRQTVREFRQRAEEGDFTAVIDDSGRHTARDLLDRAVALTEAMTPDGTPGGTVMVQADNSWRTVVATLAAGMTGGVLAVVNRHTTGAEFMAALDDIRPDAVIAEPSALREWHGPGLPEGWTAEVLDGWTVLAARGSRPCRRTPACPATPCALPDCLNGAGGAPTRRTGQSPEYLRYEGGRPAHREHAPDAAGPALRADDGGATTGPRDVTRWNGGAVIGFTSGSTGRPKGVVQSESALRYACSRTRDINGLRPGDAVAALVPLSSTAAYCFGVCMSLMLAGPLVLTSRWDPGAALTRMAEHQVRWTMCVPTMALQMGSVAAGSRVLEGVHSITVGGGPMDRGALARAERSLGTSILRVFGMSECLGHTSPRPDDPEEIRLGRDGRPFPGTELRAVAADGTVLGPGETGRAQVRGPSLFLGYAREGQVEPPALTPDGFLPTGDLLITAHNGTVTVMGREKDVIIRGGRNLDITEIERAVASHPKVARVCVAPVPDPLLGERPAVLVVSEDDSGDLHLDEITEHLRRTGLSKAKWPEFVFSVSELPQTRVGKLDRGGARELARELYARRSGVPGPPGARPEPHELGDV